MEGDTYSSWSDLASGLDDKNGIWRICTYLQIPMINKKPPPITVECKNLSVSMSATWPDISTMGVYQGIRMVETADVGLESIW